ncbi:MAG: GNAT family N-acetyltransferase [Thermoleophilaceae bacterium]
MSAQTTFRVRRARSQEDVDDALELRRQVFGHEQGVTFEADRDGRDGEAVHLVALAKERVIGTCRLLPTGAEVRLGRMVVEPAVRGGGVGARLLEVADRVCEEMGHDLVVAHAQVAARGVYDRAGYIQRGEPFVEQGIEHVTMEKALA